jgi:ATP-dependent DNA helicase RecG
LANAHGGFVVIGIDEGFGSHRFRRSPHKNANPQWLHGRIQDLTVPPVECVCWDASSLLRDSVGQDACECIAIKVSKAKTPGAHFYTRKGVSKIRVGKDCKPYFSAEDDRSRAVVPEATIQDLSERSISWAISLRQKKFKMSGHVAIDTKEFLRQARLLELETDPNTCRVEERFPLAAVLMLGTESALYRHAPYFEVIVKTPTETKSLRRNIVDCYKYLCGTDSSLLPSLCPKVPLETFRELVANALIHRDYRSNGPVVLEVTDSYCELRNPGELPVGVSIHDLIHCVPVYRNFLLAEAARIFGLCDKIGRGIDVIFDTVLSDGFDFPFFESRNNSFVARLSFARSAEFREFVHRRGQALGNLDELVVLRYLWANPVATLNELATAMQRSVETTRVVAQGMEKKSMICLDEQSRTYSLSYVVRNDIEKVFQSDQLTFDSGFLGD